MEHPLVFKVGGEDLLGILHEGAAGAEHGVLIVVGGPQYRVGSHRQFLLLARHLAAAGIPVFRFDYRGMGDSGGDQRDFERVGEDIRAAIDVFMGQVPQLREVVLWGLCDAASAAVLYAHRDPRVKGLVLANPWVRTEEGLARAFLHHYYLKRVTSRDFWSNLVRGRLNPMASARFIGGMLSRVVGGAMAPSARREVGDAGPSPNQPLPERMAWGWKRFQGPVLVVLSGADLVANEFRDTAASSPVWRGLLEQPRVTLRALPESNHTFSRKVWRDQVAAWTLDWINQSNRSPDEAKRNPGMG
jgi:uncharacterized protein